MDQVHATQDKAFPLHFLCFFSSKANATLQNNNYNTIGNIKTKYSKIIRGAMLQMVASSEHKTIPPALQSNLSGGQTSLLCNMNQGERNKANRMSPECSPICQLCMKDEEWDAHESEQCEWGRSELQVRRKSLKKRVKLKRRSALLCSD